MDPFVRRLIERLHAPGAHLSRNRHFHTFDTPEGRLALRTSRRLKSLQRDILACCKEGHVPTFKTNEKPDGGRRVELRFEKLSGRRVSHLTEEEFQLLCQLPGIAEALHPLLSA